MPENRTMTRAAFESFTPWRQKAVTLWAARLKTSTLATVPRDLLANAVRQCGAIGVAHIFATDTEAVNDRLAVLGTSPVVSTNLASPPPTGIIRPRHVVVSSSELGDNWTARHHIDRLENGRALEDDARRAVPLITLKTGTRFKLPNDPDDRIQGREGVLVYVNDCRARVRFGGNVHVTISTQDDNGDDTTVDFDRPGRAVNIAARTLVVPL